MKEDFYFNRRTVVLLLTYQCNLKCSYCYLLEKKHKTMSIEIAKEVITKSFYKKFYSDKDEIQIDFMGGEPLLEFDKIKDIAEWMWSKEWPKPYILFATTNGTLLNKEMKDWFKKNNDRIVLGLSFDGTGSMQNENRSDSSEKIDISYFINTWPHQPVKMTISRETLPDLANGIIHLHHEGFQDIHANLAYGVTWKKSDLTHYKDQLNHLVDFYLDNKNIKRSSLLNLDITKILYPHRKEKYCGAGTGMSLYDFNGKEYPCHLFSPLVLNTSEIERLNDIDFNDTAFFENKMCNLCRLFNICPTCYGMNLKHLRHVSERDIFHCKAFIEQFLANCRLQSKILDSRTEFTKEDKLIAYTILKVSKSLILKV